MCNGLQASFGYVALGKKRWYSLMTGLLDNESGAGTIQRRKTYSGAFKAQVVRELLNGKKTLRDLAEYHSLHPNQIKNWKSVLLKQAAHVWRG